jgi:hypothetical protein
MSAAILVYPAFPPQSIEAPFACDPLFRTEAVIRCAFAVSLRTKCALRFAIAGFVIALALCAYTFYINSHGRMANAALFLILCPPSIGAIALDNAGVVGALIGWFFVGVENAVIYGIVGFGVGDKLQRRRN